MGYIFHFSNFLDENTLCIELEIQDWNLDCYIVLDLCFSIDVKADLPETSPFLFAQMAGLSKFFQMFMVLGMYNFASKLQREVIILRASAKKSLLCCT